MKYLVMECHPAYAVVLSEDGVFRKVANLHYAVGQSVEEVVFLQLPEEKPAIKRKHKWMGTIAAAAACLALTVTAFFYAEAVPYATVYMTINPEVRIDVNRKDAVVAVEGINADGEALVANYIHKGKNLDVVMDDLVDLAIDQGYLHKGGKITVSLDAKQTWVDSHSDQLNTHLRDHLAEKMAVTIDVEQRQVPPSVPEPEIPVKPITIPIAPESYGDSDYDDERDTEGASDYDEEDDREPEHTDYDPEEKGGSSDYKASGEEDGKTDYDADDSNSDYQKDDGKTDYDVKDKDSDYQASASGSKNSESSRDTEKSDYDKPEKSDSPYEKEEDDEDSDYEKKKK